MKTTEIDLADIVKTLETRIADECETVDTGEAYDSMLDDCYDFSAVGGPFAGMLPSRVLRECDPIAYRCGANDYADSCRWIEIGRDSYEQRECEAVKDELQSELDALESELEDEMEEAEGEEEQDAEEVARITGELAQIRAALATLKKHSF